jgi:hypothetical protein
MAQSENVKITSQNNVDSTFKLKFSLHYELVPKELRVNGKIYHEVIKSLLLKFIALGRVSGKCVLVYSA